MNKICCGDFRDYNFPEEAFFISDPPYNQRYHYNEYRDNKSLSEYKELLSSAFRGRKSVIIHYPEESINLLPAIMERGTEEVVSWIYNSNTAKQHRLITWWGCKPDFKKIPQPYKNPTDKRIAKRIAEGKAARSYDWWNVNQVKNVSKKNNSHTCPMPLEIMEKIILSTTEPGDLIVDPFCGSGTTCLAAKKHGRNYIGIDISEEYCRIAEERLSTTDHNQIYPYPNISQLKGLT